MAVEVDVWASIFWEGRGEEGGGLWCVSVGTAAAAGLRLSCETGLYCCCRRRSFLRPLCILCYCFMPPL